MAKISIKPALKVDIHFTVSEIEANALVDLAGYGTDAFIEAFYKELGKAYMEKHEAGLRTFLDTIRQAVQPGLSKIKKARELLHRAD